MKTPRIALLALFAASFSLACAASIDPSGGSSSSGAGGGTGGEGGDTSTTTSGSAMTSGGTGGSTSCVKAADCLFLGDVCNTGTCINGQCAKTPANDYGSCNDGQFCTENDICLDGQCVGGKSKYCPGLDICHVGVCDEDLDTCKNIPGNDGADCDDGDPCTYVGYCMGGVCGKGNPVDCTVYDSQCTVGICDPDEGCLPAPSNENGSCDDGLYCTVGDHCEVGECVGAPNTCAAPGDVCMIGSCNEATDTCVAVPGNNGASCSDGNDCTAGETCSNGTCVGGQPVPNGMACDDKNGCTFGTTCVNGNCQNPTSQTMACVGNDQCCPAGCDGNLDSDCLYWKSGVQQNVPENALAGWTQCYKGTYNDGQPTVAQILAQCDKGKLLMACRQTGSPSFTLVAMGNRPDVLWPCGSDSSCVHQGNGVGWYFDASYSWGFAPGGLPVNRFSCDYNDGSQQLPEQRMCWHTGGGSISQGYRCGNNDLNFGPDWERVIYETD